MLGLLKRAYYKLLREARTLFAPRPTSGVGRVVFRDADVRFVMKRHPNSKFMLNGTLFIQSDHGDRGYVQITLGDNSALLIDGDFMVGSGVRIVVSENATLRIGGKRDSSGSGITCNTRLLVNRDLQIGYDTIISWDCFITDSDWHQLVGVESTMPTQIGDRVWIGRGVSILKGTSVGSGCVIGSNALLSGKCFEENSLIAGVPARVIRMDVAWCREMLQANQS